MRLVLPLRTSTAEAERFVRSKSTWLLRHLARFDRLRKIVPDRKFVSGTTLPFLGVELTLDVVPGPRGVERKGDRLVVAHPAPTESIVRRELEAWYRARAAEEVGRRVGGLARQFNIKVKAVSVGGAATRWGTCSPKGRVRFNWRLMLAPSEILDYMVAHELAHIDRRNHSAAFWTRVTELHPQWPAAEKWLKYNGRGLVL